MISALADCFRSVKEAHESCKDGLDITLIIEDFQNGVANTPEGARFLQCLKDMVRSAGIITENIQPNEAV